MDDISDMRSSNDRTHKYYHLWYQERLMEYKTDLQS